MKIFFPLAVFLLMGMANTVFGQQMPPVEAGVSRELARYRAAHYSDVRYQLNLTLEKGAPLLKGSIEIRVNLTDVGAKNDLVLDWRTTAFANDKDKPFARVVAVNEKSSINSNESLWLVRDEHLIVSSSLLKTSENTIKIEFASPIKTSGAAVTRYVDKEDGAEYIYSLFVPSDASTAFPCFDQPDLKARFQLEVVAPKEWKVISNEGGITMLDGRIDDTKFPEGFYGHNFYETKPISTYVFAFAAGEFVRFGDESEEAKAQRAERTKLLQQDLIVGKGFGELLTKKADDQTSIYVRKSQAEKFKQHAAEVFRLNREAVTYLEGYFDYKFPFPKYDLVLLPEFPFRGMEHAGATFLREDSIIFPSEPTANDYISRGSVIFHEAAHQWFGDTVTMRWFDDLWLKEGFAEFMAYKTMSVVMPQYNAWKAFYERNKPLAYLTDSTKGTTPIYQEIPNLNSAKSAYGNIVYRKAPAFLRQAEFYLGEKQFQIAVRAFLKQNAFKNAEWQDLVKQFQIADWSIEPYPYYAKLSPKEKKELEAEDKKVVSDWAEGWVMQRGLPIVRSAYDTGHTEIEISPTKHVAWLIPILRLKQTNVLGENNIWRMQTKILYRAGGVTKTEVVRFHSGGESIGYISKVFNTPESRKLDFKPDLVFPNYEDYGYGIFLLDERSRNYILGNIQNEKDDFLRSMMWGALWDSLREGELKPVDYIELAIENIAVERDELTIQTILNRVSIAMNYYLTPEQLSELLPDEELEPRLEKVLLERMTHAATLGQRIVFYRAFLQTAATGNARQTLKDVLSGKLKIEGLTLKTKDRFDIVTRLLVLGDADALALLADLEKTEQSDEAKRYAYAARAGIATAENKQKFYADFTSNKEISESWIESATAPFNSVRQADLTAPFLEKALQELPNLKRNRKIFFVNGWLAAFIGGQRDERSLATVNKFLSDNPNLDKDLRLKILEAADGLERGIKIRRQYAGK